MEEILNIIWVINNGEIPAFMYHAIVDTLIQNPEISITLFIDNKAPNISLGKTLQFVSKVDRRFRKYEINPLQLIHVDTLENPRLTIISGRTNLKPCDLVILPNMDSYGKKTFAPLASIGILCFEFDSVLITKIATDNKDGLPISFWYRKSTEKKWSLISNMNINTEKGVVNCVEKYLWFQKCSLLKFLKNPDDYSKIPIVPVDNYTRTKLVLHYMLLCLLIVKRKIHNKKYLWKLAIKNGATYAMLDQPKNAFWADPFIITEGDYHYIFFEELNQTTCLGEIACIKVNLNFNIEEKKTIFKDNTHFSFPNVFPFDGTYYMIPENSEIDRLDLYEATEFPYKWKLKRTMMHDIKLLDATWTYHDNLYWIFANKVECHESDNNDLLYLYYSDDLINGKWTPHKKNPIITDSGKARNAGAIYSENGKLYRPSQDCNRLYGAKIAINEILTLTVSDYSEICVSTMIPPPGFKGIHTFNSDKGISVIDLLH